MRSGRFIWRMLYRCIFHIIHASATYIATLILLRLVLNLCAAADLFGVCYTGVYFISSMRLLYIYRTSNHPPFISEVMRSGRFIWRMLYRCIFHIIHASATYIATLILLRLVLKLCAAADLFGVCYTGVYFISSMRLLHILYIYIYIYIYISYL